MGEAHYRAREYWAAVHWFKKALKISRNSASTHVRLGRAYMKVNKRSRACKHFKKASKLRPNSRSYRRIVENYRCR
jgi:Flp pilus assembly protein TadD